MFEFHTKSAYIEFHCYKGNKRKKKFLFFDDDEYLDVQIDIQGEKTLDLSKYEEVQIYQEKYREWEWYFDDGMEMDDDYKVLVEPLTVILPNKEKLSYLRIVDPYTDYDSNIFHEFEFVKKLSVTKDGMFSL